MISELLFVAIFYTLALVANGVSCTIAIPIAIGLCYLHLRIQLWMLRFKDHRPTSDATIVSNGARHLWLPGGLKDWRPRYDVYQQLATELCYRCWCINLDERRLLHHDIQGLRDSAQQGCPLCKLILSSAGDVVQHRFLDKSRRGSVAGRSSTIQIAVDTGDMLYKLQDWCLENSHIFDFFRHRGGFLPDDNAISRREFQHHPASEDSFKLVSNWLAICLDSHVDCRQEDTPLPSRILDVSHGRLSLVNGKGLTGKYITLSHCWGVKPTTMTTSATLSKRQHAIEVSSLPQTFQDAIVITRMLAIPYLWIDSLCIIQDSKGDWAYESARMKDYYQNGYLTISALDSTDSHHGIFHCREKVPSVQLTSEPNLFIRPRPRTQREIFKDAPLNRRAWALQERLLSTRIVHYSRTEMFWECLTCSSRESDAAEHAGKVDPDSLLSSEGEDFKRILSLLAADGSSNGCEATSVWYRLVTQYTRRKLTHVSDKLTAISGLASKFHGITHYTYLAGIWKEDVIGLLWHADFSDDKSRLNDDLGPEEYRAPSWSWASVDMPVNFRFDNDKLVSAPQDAKVVDGGVGLVGTDPFGQVRSGYIRLRAVICTIRYVTGHMNEISLRGWDKKSWVGNGYLDVLPDLIQSQKEAVRHCVGIWIVQRNRTNFDRVVEKVLYCLLVLEDETEHNRWRRIGLATTVKQNTEDFEFSEPQELVII